MHVRLHINQKVSSSAPSIRTVFTASDCCSDSTSSIYSCFKLSTCQTSCELVTTGPTSPRPRSCQLKHTKVWCLDHKWRTEPLWFLGGWKDWNVKLRGRLFPSCRGGRVHVVDTLPQHTESNVNPGFTSQMWTTARSSVGMFLSASTNSIQVPTHPFISVTMWRFENI